MIGEVEKKNKTKQKSMECTFMLKKGDVPRKERERKGIDT